MRPYNVEFKSARRWISLAFVLQVLGCATGQTTPGAVGVPVQPFRLAFVQTRTHATYTLEIRNWIFTMDSEGKNVRDLKLDGSYPSWSPDGKKIAFSSAKDETHAELYVSDPDGSHIQRLTRRKGGTGVSRPVWSPDGRQIAFFALVGRIPEIFVVNCDGGEATQVSSGGGIYPTWSPDSRKIAFASARNGSIQLYSFNLDGSGLLQLTNMKSGASEPAWSPDGNKILFTVVEGVGSEGVATIGILDVSSLKTTRFAYSDKFNFFSPTWSPDGRTVLMELSRKGGFFLQTSDPYVPPAEKVIGWKHQIIAVSVDGAVSRQLTKADDGGTQPSAGKMP